MTQNEAHQEVVWVNRPAAEARWDWDLAQRGERGRGTTGRATRDQPEEAHAAACLRRRAAIRRPFAAAHAVSFSHGGTEARRRERKREKSERCLAHARHEPRWCVACARHRFCAPFAFRRGPFSVPPCLRERPRDRQPHTAARAPTALHPHESLKTRKKKRAPAMNRGACGFAFNSIAHARSREVTRGHARSKRSRFITFVHADTKSHTNFPCASAEA